MPSIEVLKGGIEVTVQDYPGRLGYWNLGIPPSGPMDSLSFRIANLLVGNSPGEAALEIAAGLASFKFRGPAVIALAGADMRPKLNEAPAPLWESIPVKDGDVLSLSSVAGHGFRCYLAVAGGIGVPEYLGSRSTFAAGGFGGYQGRALKAGDVIPLGEPRRPLKELEGRVADPKVRPAFTSNWEVEAMVGPQAAPDFFTEEGVESFFTQTFKVDRNSNRLGYRLNSTSWKWARADGGVAGRHPSNILDNGYTVGAVNVCGDQPIILTVDGPSLGGFVCIACVPSAFLWKVGQAIPAKDTMRFKKVALGEAVSEKARLRELLNEAFK